VTKRVLRANIHPTARTVYLPLYDMNRNDDAKRAAFLARVDAAMRAF
jgi:hypothetical protein